MEEKNQLFTILQASERLNVPRATLRFWEKELKGGFVPLRTNGGQRRYTLENLLVLQEIKRCRERGLSLSRIVEKIKFGTGRDKVPSQEIDLLAVRIAEAVKKEVYSFFEERNE